MIQARWSASGVELVDVEPPPLRPGWVRVSVAACGICGSDLHRWRGEIPGEGAVPGHEIAGRVGDALYAIEPRWRCGACALCRAGKPQLCREGGIFGVHAAGGLAEWIDVPEYALHALPAGIHPLLGSLAEPLAVALRAVERAGIARGDRLLVLGAGSLGLLCGLVARERGARVAISARYPEQRAAAERLGLLPLRETELRAWSADEPARSVIETVGGAARTLAEALAACAPAGRVVVLGVFSVEPQIDALELMAREIELVGSNSYGHEHGSDFARAIALLGPLAAELAPLQTHRFPLRALGDAFRAAADKHSGALKVVLEVSA